MLATAAVMVLAIYQQELPPSSAFLPPTDVQEERLYQRKDAMPAAPGSQRLNDGTVRDEAGKARIDTGLYPTESSGGAVVIPR